jgi:hypothetical protein
MNQPSTGGEEANYQQSALYAQVEALAAQVRAMTEGETNVPTPGSPLALELQERAPGQVYVNCGDFANVLQSMLQSSSIPSRQRSTTFNGNEGHVMNEFFDPYWNKWVVADAFFGLVYLVDTSTPGESVADINAAIVNKDAGSLHYTLVTPSGDDFLRYYYMDPLLVYLNPAPPGGVPTVVNSPMNYLVSQNPAEIAGEPETYLFDFARVSDSAEVVNGAAGQMSIAPILTTAPFWAPAVILYPGWSYVSLPATAQIYTIPVYWSNTSTVLGPWHNQTDVDASAPVLFWWTQVAGATGYELNVGSSPGAKDVFDSGQTTALSLQVSLNPSTSYYVRMWTLYNGFWNYHDSTFATGTGYARIITPPNGATNVNAGAPVQIQWTSIPDEQTYSLYVGTTMGAQNIYSSGATQATSVAVSLLPGTKYYLRIWTEKYGDWFYTDSNFTTQ